MANKQYEKSEGNKSNISRQVEQTEYDQSAHQEYNQRRF